MTWNLLTETATHRPPWSVRGPAVAQRITELAPAVLGTQEGSRSMLDDLVSRLPAGLVQPASSHPSLEAHP